MLAYRQRIEAGPWFSVGLPLDADGVQSRLVDLGRSALPRPYAVYVHVPFCAAICSFCQLYTRAVPSGSDEVLDEYVEKVIQSIERHPWAHPSHPPTTVHFGGGTPLFLGTDRFGKVVGALRRTFGTSDACEWAVETTTSAMDVERMDALAALGFQRIHLGIQTLDDTTRTRLGRNEPGDKAIERIETLEARGFLTSVDLIIGFEGVDASVVADDLRRLHDAGVRMFSICELRERNKPRLGIRDAAEKASNNYAIWKLIWDFMADVGLAPIHLGQFGRRQADNLYFTHPARGEDCLAIGPYSHGCSGDLYYGNAMLPEYYAALGSGRPPIKTGVLYGDDARVIRAIERELLAHCLSRKVIDDACAMYPTVFPQILESWLRHRLLVESGDRASLQHTLEGSWFVGNMIGEARGMLDPAARLVRERSA